MLLKCGIPPKWIFHKKIEKIQKFFTRIAFKRYNIAARSYDEGLEITQTA